MQVFLSPIIRSQILRVLLLVIAMQLYQRSFTYILDHCGLGALLELEQNNVYDGHLEDLDEARSTVAGPLRIEVDEARLDIDDV
jgi:hypothetical protein